MKIKRLDEPSNVGLEPDVLAVMRLYEGIQITSMTAIKPLWRSQGLSERAIFILSLIGVGVNRPGRLIEIFDVLPSTITFETDKLVAAGLIVRSRLDTDRRATILELTAKGEETHREMSRLLNAAIQARLNRLAPGELETFLNIGWKFIKPSDVTEERDIDEASQPPH